MSNIQGPGVFLAQFLGDKSLEELCKWFSDLGYKGIQVPTWDPSVFDLEVAASSQDYCDEFKGKIHSYGLEVIELASYLQGQVLALHPAYEMMFQAFFPKGLNAAERTAWATEQLINTVKASKNLGTRNISTLSGGFAWHLMYPWPQRPPGIIEEAFKALAGVWTPVLDAASEHGITFGYELHPGSDLYDGATYENFLDKTGGHPAACITYDPSHLLLQQLNYIEFIKLYSDRIRAFHVKDAEFRPDGRTGVYGGYQSWQQRAGRFRSLGDGQVDFKHIFTLLSQSDYRGWAILEWECCVKSAEQGAREGAGFISEHLIEVTEKAFDDFAKGATDREMNLKILGLKES